MYIRDLRAGVRGWCVGRDELHTCSFPLPLHTANQIDAAYRQWQLPCAAHNFQRWMSRFEQRWRAQRSAISIVNCRIPWTDRDLNAYCAFGISLKACLLQCLFCVVSAAVAFKHAAVRFCASRCACYLCQCFWGMRLTRLYCDGQITKASVVCSYSCSSQFGTFIHDLVIPDVKTWS